ncbi:hypothetical protein LTR70_002722 [Exophiala xenobiotica]|uniref:EthD domain-containing protein n=1 Tax=Lithohypha guttulata TaxID=1690604 RepID=A0ABR0KJM8_9EURO|nr:hypothetical protein LTR24_001828 [Lithohypha guttulata]KAK5324648.1 hypothetical protein LTR70_002722 [Exophiala xenobiotica]
MAPSSYLLHVNSRPTVVSCDLWCEWYRDEHLPDLVNGGVSARATFYEEEDPPVPTGLPNPRKFLALYQTDIEELLKSEKYINGRKTSSLFPKEGGTDSIIENGDFDARNYELIQEFDPKGTGEKPPPIIVTVEMNPADEKDFDKWYREEHLDMLSKMPGYRRSLRYKLGPKTPLTQGETQPAFLAIHEVDSMDAFASEEGQAASTTEWSVKQIQESKPFIARAWKLVHAQGYGGEMRT